ncbi:MAG: hypothetical protein IKN03_00330 [Fibrobacter sp.]|nr:hypothetical protein [Fibrobacter sp.]MBR6853840.1 hypothetical protein [Fibrobacter sp.]
MRNLRKAFCKKNTWAWLAVVAILGVVLAIGGCAMARKLSAADILSKTKVEFSELTLDSVSVNPDILNQLGGAIVGGLLPNPNVVAFVQNIAKGIIQIDVGNAHLGIVLNVTNADQDTLWLRDFTASINLDSLMELPLQLKDSTRLAPGITKVRLSTSFPIDNRIFKLKDITGLNAKGVLVVALEQEGESVPFDFNIRHNIPHEELVALEDSLRQSVLNSILSDWVGSIKF